jgi:hypothetical protein
VNVAAIMQDSPPPPPMLLPHWLAAGVVHWLYSDAEAGKTWLALWWAGQVMAEGGTVVWLDEELGREEIARRLLALEVAHSAVAKRFVFYDFAGWGASADLPEWRDLLDRTRPALVVIDTATDALVNADLDENSGPDVTRWVKAFCEPATRLGAATAVLDHTGRADATRPGRHAVGSRAKRAKAKVQYSMRVRAGYGPSTLGKVEVTRTKNTIGAEIPARTRTMQLGGDGNGGFVIREQAPGTGLDFTADGESSAPRSVGLMMNRVLRALEAHPGQPLTTNQVKALVTGKGTVIAQALAALHESDLYPNVTATPGPRGSTQYMYTADA